MTRLGAAVILALAWAVSLGAQSTPSIRTPHPNPIRRKVQAIQRVFRRGQASLENSLQTSILNIRRWVIVWRWK